MSSPIMRFIFLALLGMGWLLPLRAETFTEWTRAAPNADVTFTPWDGDLPETSYEEEAAHPLVQKLYGYLDLSRLPAEAFPLKLRLIYDPIKPRDVDPGRPAILSEPNDAAAVGSGLITEETIIPTSNDAHSIPVWIEPAPMQERLRYANAEESVRAEILDQKDKLLVRLVVGASRLASQRPRALLINAPAGRTAFVRSGYSNISEASKLVPDSFALVGVDAVWVDTPTVNDPRLGDSFWQAVVLGGTRIVGLPGDIAILTGRLHVAAGQAILLGALVPADSPGTGAPGLVRPAYGARVTVDGRNPFAFSSNLGEMMHHELLTFSVWYLVVFVVLQVAVIVGGFALLQGSNRVWIWLVTPGFALLYAVVGVALSYCVVHARSDSQLSEIELVREGWTQAVLFTNLEQIDLQDHHAVLDLPPDSRPFFSGDLNTLVSTQSRAIFYHDTSNARLELYCTSAAQTSAHVRSLIKAVPPCDLLGDGQLNPDREFVGAWFWDGSQWHDLGPLVKDHPVEWKMKSVIHPPDWIMRNRYMFLGDDSSFPGVLGPLLSHVTLESIAEAGDGLFIGAERVSTVPLHGDKNDRVATRRIVAYQFHLSGAPK